MTISEEVILSEYILNRFPKVDVQSLSQYLILLP